MSYCMMILFRVLEQGLVLVFTVLMVVEGTVCTFCIYGFLPDWPSLQNLVMKGKMH